MAKDIALAAKSAEALNAPQRAGTRIQIGERSSAGTEVEVTPAGMLAFGAMVGMILLGSAAIVRAAQRRT